MKTNKRIENVWENEMMMIMFKIIVKPLKRLDFSLNFVSSSSCSTEQENGLKMMMMITWWELGVCFHQFSLALWLDEDEEEEEKCFVFIIRRLFTLYHNLCSFIGIAINHDHHK